MTCGTRSARNAWFRPAAHTGTKVLTFITRRLLSILLSCRLRFSLYYMITVRSPTRRSAVDISLPFAAHPQEVRTSV